MDASFKEDIIVKEDDKEVVEKVVDLVSGTLINMGVTLVGFENLSIPTYYVKVDRKKLVESLENTMTAVYWTLWTLTYGKFQKLDKRRIDLRYEEVS